MSCRDRLRFLVLTDFPWSFLPSLCPVCACCVDLCLCLFSCSSDKTIKYWKVHEKKIKRPTKIESMGALPSHTPTYLSADVPIPRLTHHQTITTATPKRVYSNAHGYHINSISINSDGETFISADDLRINLWNLQISNETFNVVDVKPPNLEELTEVITSATFHPHHCSQLIYSSSRGSIRLADLRDSALCDQHAKLFEVEEDPSQKSFFSEIISSISDAQFIGHEGRYILSRDYLTLKVWDVHMENRPVAVIPIHEYLKVHLCDLYENVRREKRHSRDGQPAQSLLHSASSHVVGCFVSPHICLSSFCLFVCSSPCV